MLLEARGLHIAFGGVIAVDEVSFTVKAGSMAPIWYLSVRPMGAR